MIGKVVSPIKPLQRRTNAACGSWISAAALDARQVPPGWRDMKRSLQMAPWW